MTDFHENFTAREAKNRSSERSFGFLFSFIFIVVGLLPAWTGDLVRYWAVGLSLLLLCVSLMRPVLLTKPNHAWLRLGLLLGKVVSPIALAIVYFGVVCPVGLLLRLFDKDSLSLKIDPDATTYWIDRDPPGVSPESFTRQY